VQTYKGKKLLWVTFSSNRDYGLHLVNKGFDNCYPAEGPTYDDPQPLSKQGVTYANCAQPQIWMAGVIVEEDGTLDMKDRSFRRSGCRSRTSTATTTARSGSRRCRAPRLPPTTRAPAARASWRAARAPPQRAAPTASAAPAPAPSPA